MKRPKDLDRAENNGRDNLVGRVLIQTLTPKRYTLNPQLQTLRFP